MCRIRSFRILRYKNRVFPAMIPKKTATNQMPLFSLFRDTLDQNAPLYVLAEKIDWKRFEDAFLPLYCQDNGRPAKPIRRMVGLLILKYLRNRSDELVVEEWKENVYFQYFCGEQSLQVCPPCTASELVHFRNRIGEKGMELILQESIRVNGDDSNDKHVCVDTTVQEKNITYPTDQKLHRKIIDKCVKMAEEAGVALRQTYPRVLKKLRDDQRFRNHPLNKKRAKKADKKVKTIAGRLVRELERKLPENSVYKSELDLFTKVLAQKRNSKDKIYSLHEQEVCCIAKGKEHKKYEFGNKASIVRTTTGVIVGALSFRNEYDGHTLPEALEQVKRLTGQEPETATVDRGYAGIKQYGQTEVIKPERLKKGSSWRAIKKYKERLRKRVAIEPTIGHLKQDHRVGRNFLKGIKGDMMNIMLAAAAYNFKRAMRRHSSFILPQLEWIYFCISNLLKQLFGWKLAF